VTLSAEDTIAIHQLYGRACHTMDEGDVDGYVDCFVPEGALRGAGKSREGHDALRSFATRLIGSGIRHVVGSIYVTGSGDEAEGRAYLVAHKGSPGEVLTRGRYRDQLRRVDTTWRFVDRFFTPDDVAAS
jgi:hypothetical protein